ncbi:hypothetical protein HU200_041017 [Digitaria exilis]|uniref:Uncharacterized protein n=1 Tax=Digitaria exilis TaxID=1010633 RepID=A0A835EE45_9POAL|nr:hypothetical protein HU200_041017 [Digitaria exilis]
MENVGQGKAIADHHSPRAGDDVTEAVKGDKGDSLQLAMANLLEDARLGAPTETPDPPSTKPDSRVDTHQRKPTAAVLNDLSWLALRGEAMVGFRSLWLLAVANRGLLGADGAQPRDCVKRLYRQLTRGAGGRGWGVGVYGQQVWRPPWLAILLAPPLQLAIDDDDRGLDIAFGPPHADMEEMLATAPGLVELRLRDIVFHIAGDGGLPLSCAWRSPELGSGRLGVCPSWSVRMSDYFKLFVALSGVKELNVGNFNGRTYQPYHFSLPPLLLPRSTWWADIAPRGVAGAWRHAVGLQGKRGMEPEALCVLMKTSPVWHKSPWVERQPWWPIEGVFTGARLGVELPAAEWSIPMLGAAARSGSCGGPTWASLSLSPA